MGEPVSNVDLSSQLNRRCAGSRFAFDYLPSGDSGHTKQSRHGSERPVLVSSMNEKRAALRLLSQHEVASFTRLAMSNPSVSSVEDP